MGFTVITRNGRQTLYVRWKGGGESKDPAPVLAPLLPKTATEEAALRRKVQAGTSPPQEERRLLNLPLSK